MSSSEISIDVAPHPLLRPGAFVTRFPEPLGDITTPDWVMGLLSLEPSPTGAQVPFQPSEDVRLAMRDTLRHWGHKPAGRGKPAAEYLVRAVDRGKLGSINVAVDICNVVSLHSQFSIALVDLGRARPPFRVDQGPEDGSYVFNPAGQEMSLEGLICLYDAQGPCGNPVKDAQRVKTREGTTETLTVMWGVKGHEDRRDRALEWYREMLERVGAETRDAAVRMEAG